MRLHQRILSPSLVVRKSTRNLDNAVTGESMS
jgi:hypothetical protein